MKFFSSLFFVFIFVFPLLVFAQEQTVELNAEISDSAKTFSWLYSENTKSLIVGISITIMTILIGVGLYYLIKLVY